MKDDMKERIRRTCENIPRSVLAETVRSFQNRVQFFLNQNGNVFGHPL